MTPIFWPVTCRKPATSITFRDHFLGKQSVIKFTTSVSALIFAALHCALRQSGRTRRSYLVLWLHSSGIRKRNWFTKDGFFEKHLSDRLRCSVLFQWSNTPRIMYMETEVEFTFLSVLHLVEELLQTMTTLRSGNEIRARWRRGWVSESRPCLVTILTEPNGWRLSDNLS